MCTRDRHRPEQNAATPRYGAELSRGTADGNRRFLTAAKVSCFTRPRLGAFDYRWPVRPFGVQHPVRGNFGDPRTISAAGLGADDAGDRGVYSFHSGVDISASPGSPVYPVVSGFVQVRNTDEVIVHVPGGLRTFQYWHIRPRVRDGEWVIVDRTVLGVVKAIARHVHLTEIDGDKVTNPAQHLRPYQDTTPPTVQVVTIVNPAGRTLNPNAVAGVVSIVAEASDVPPLPVPGNWNGFPVTPARVSWTLSDAVGRSVLPARVVVDFRRFEPRTRRFWSVYAAGTYQNFPVFDDHFYWRQAGRYLFKLTRRPLDTGRLPNGGYSLRVTASDICGNRGTFSEPLRIAND